MTVRGSCHCGKTSFRIDGEIPEQLTRCTCSVCAKRGMLVAYYPPEAFFVEPSDADVIYRWHTDQVALHACSHCGCPTYNDSPAFGKDGSWDGVTRRIGVNARLFDDYDAASAPVVVIDGKNLW